MQLSQITLDATIKTKQIKIIIRSTYNSPFLTQQNWKNDYALCRTFKKGHIYGDVQVFEKYKSQKVCGIYFKPLLLS